MRKVQRFGSVIGLKPEYEERYIILHKYPFHGVLRRIHDSNIHNYSIFLRHGRLFSYYEYYGQDYDNDMLRMAEDSITQDWWKLTDPMQEPIQDRKEGEWWASMDEIAHFSSTPARSASAPRRAYRAQMGSILVKKIDIPKDIIDSGPLHKLSVFHKQEYLYLYCEFEKTSRLSALDRKGHITDTILSRMTYDDQVCHWEVMREVFHTD